MKTQIVDFSIQRPKWVFTLISLLVVLLAAQIPSIQVDTDPENMLPADQEERQIHNRIKKDFALHDMLVVGVVNHQQPRGIYNPESLQLIEQLSRGILAIEGVIEADLMSLSTVDNIQQQGPGTIRFSWMMREAPSTQSAADDIRQAVGRLPLLHNTLVSGDGQAAGIYVPIVEKSESYRIASEIELLVNQLGGTANGRGDAIHITGLPVAEDTFGVEMFIQMAISAPLAALVIFLLMWYFFRSLLLITAPMLVAMATVIATMGLLIGLGYKVHIMSSMIPIFLMPIAVVDSIHLLSEFSDRYRPGSKVKTLLREVVGHLFTPMLFTSITSSIGFASLAFTPIPPVQIFGLHVALGIGLAFLLTITLIPAYIMCLPQSKLLRLQAQHHAHQQDGQHQSLLARALRSLGQASLKHARLFGLGFLALFVLALYGIQQIQINDNPVRWFKESHRIRVADQTLNQHFAGTYNAFLVLNQKDSQRLHDAFAREVGDLLAKAQQTQPELPKLWQRLQPNAQGFLYFQELISAIEEQLFSSPQAQAGHWEQLLSISEAYLVASKYFQTPGSLNYISDLQGALLDSGYVGKSNSLADLVKTVHRELRSGEAEAFRIPNSSAAVAQTLLSFQGSHRPHDLWHMVTPDYRSSAIWLQLKSGDNQDMSKVLEFVDDYIAQHPLPDGLSLEWGGLTYINVIWQEAMVNGMLSSLLGAFVMVLIVMTLLFRSISFGLISMIPLTLSISFIYGLIGLIGKDYDMPVAVLSALTLGLSIDFAIHFVQRARQLHAETGYWPDTIRQMFEEPARAISRNAIVIAIGFLPLLAAPLIPYVTVGFFLAAIMALSSLVTIILLPILFQWLQPWLFPNTQQPNQQPVNPDKPNPGIAR